jgi:hypothetical protein
MRGDIARLGRCTQICTQGEDTIRRSKPFKYAYEKEIVMCVNLLVIPSFPYPHYILKYLGMPTSKSSIISPPNAYIPPMHIVGMRARS